MHSAVTENMIESVDMERGEAGADEEFQKIDYRTYQSQYLNVLETQSVFFLSKVE